MTISRIRARGDTWIYQGDATRSTVEFTDEHQVQSVVHERTEDGTTYKVSMEVRLVKVD